MTPRRFIFGEGALLVTEVQVRTTTGERTAYRVEVLGTTIDMELADPQMLRGIVFQAHGLSEGGLRRLDQAIHRELAGRAA